MRAPKCLCYGDDRCEAHLPETADKLAEALNALVVRFDTSTHPHPLWEQARAALVAAGWEEE